ncbi:hypothetical protein B0T17DRAFT_595027 [Bombardia bombarda]|uniref:Uncharacterized protein n=1 Tax=Bombardia bombarda TaxID=252184 RepID=A0AA39XJU5_9PEZI|nr:hypothetical protein B0T17DRAFT_595027 [Bombardia bombarda]
MRYGSGCIEGKFTGLRTRRLLNKGPKTLGCCQDDNRPCSSCHDGKACADCGHYYCNSDLASDNENDETATLDGSYVPVDDEPSADDSKGGAPLDSSDYATIYEEPDSYNSENRAPPNTSDYVPANNTSSDDAEDSSEHCSSDQDKPPTYRSLYPYDASDKDNGDSSA